MGISEGKRQIFINGKYYSAERIDGVLFVDGMTVDEFQKTLDPQSVLDMAQVGLRVVKSALNGEATPQGVQNLARELHQGRNN